MKTIFAGLPVLLALAFSGAASAQGAKNCVSGTVNLSPAIAGKVPPGGGTLFVYVREKDRAKGPPSAVVSIAKPVYPQNFTLCGTDQMVSGAPGKALAGSYRAYARHSASGRPMVQEGFQGETTGAGKAGIRAGDTVSITISRSLGK